MIRSLITIFVTIFTLNAYANDIYVTQSGASLDLDITQDGQNNQVGNSTTASTVAGASTTIDIDQVGNSNVLKFDVNGASYTGTFNVTGNSNDIDINCDSTGNNSSCGTVTASVTMVGNSNDIDLDIGETSDASNTTATITSAIFKYVTKSLFPLFKYGSYINTLTSNTSKIFFTFFPIVLKIYFFTSLDITLSKFFFIKGFGN